jgi:hypothetical protein
METEVAYHVEPEEVWKCVQLGIQDVRSWQVEYGTAVYGKHLLGITDKLIIGRNPGRKEWLHKYYACLLRSMC